MGQLAVGVRSLRRALTPRRPLATSVAEGLLSDEGIGATSSSSMFAYYLARSAERGFARLALGVSTTQMVFKW